MALIVVCLIGAEGRPVQPVTNPQQHQQIYQPGVRNSFDEHALNAKEMNLVLNQLRRKTGFVQMRFDDAGFLRVDDRQDFVGGSVLARKLVLAAIDGKNAVVLQSHNCSQEIGFARRGYETHSSHWRTDLQIIATPIEIDFDDFKHLHGHSEAIAAFDLGFVILHELCHAVLGLSDYSAKLNSAGNCENYVNGIRRELGVPERQQYAANVSLKKMFSFSPSVETATLHFLQTKPGRRHGSRAKTKTLFLRWEVQLVGGKSDYFAFSKRKPKLDSEIAQQKSLSQVTSREE
ncbi:MAG: hypothetical protein JNK38_02495 [Acidobacteria bacterium]|nr:hypothetical protein [Acidobacteriota bacterium]